MRTAKRTVFSKSTIGDEPVWDESLDSLPRVLNWYSYNKTQDDAKDYILDYAKYLNLSKSDFKAISTSKERINTSLAWISRILLNCLSTSDSLSLKVKSELDRIIEIEKTKGHVTIEPSDKKPVVNVQENIKAKLAEHLGEIEVKLDSILSHIRKDLPFEFCLKTWLRENNVSALHAKSISAHFKVGVLPELLEAQAQTCEQLTEAYSFLSSKQLKTYIQVIEQFVVDSDEQHIIKKQISIHNRTPRKTKKNPLKQVQKLKYLKETDGLKSIVPTKIIGAKAVLVYNPESRVVAYYECDNNHGLAVKGCTLLNYDVTKTVSKILRKPDEVLPTLLAEGRVAVKNALRDLSAKNKPATGRFNDKLLILRAF